VPRWDGAGNVFRLPFNEILFTTPIKEKTHDNNIRENHDRRTSNPRSAGRIARTALDGRDSIPIKAETPFGESQRYALPDDGQTLRVAISRLTTAIQQGENTWKHK
jgi:hypothetical protein